MRSAPRNLSPRLLSALMLSAGFTFGLGATARAAFTQATLLSGTAELEFNEANAPALSSDGRYAVFSGGLPDGGGIFRRNLETGQLERVAESGSAPSVSEEGRYIAFTTTEDLEPERALPDGGSEGEPAADRGCPEVYVRDMEVEPGQPGAYTLAAELNDSHEGITFSSHCDGSLGIAGAQAAAAVALSADGEDVAFTVLSPSNLAGLGSDVEPSQVLVRNLKQATTTIVSATPVGQPVVGGGAFPSSATLRESFLANKDLGFEERYGDEPTGSTAAIDAEGNTVAWLGANVSEQVSAAEAERPPIVDNADGLEAEPLWRRIGEGPEAPTRRLLAGSDLDLGFTHLAENFDDVIAGSFAGIHRAVFIPPVLSANGLKVGLLTSAPTPAIVANLSESVNSPTEELHTDAYAVSMSEDPQSPPLITPITQIPSYSLPESAIEDVKDVAISPDGTRLAFDTARTQLQLPALALISPPIEYTGTSETYEANLALGTLARVTSTYDGSEPNARAGLLAFSGDETLAFASQATNLFYGDAVEASEVYLVHELPASQQIAQTQISAPVVFEPPAPLWTIDATATPERDGEVLVDAQLPGAGRLEAEAVAQLPAPGAKPSGHDARKGPAGRRSSRSATTRPRLLARIVARAGDAVSLPSDVALRLRAGAEFRSLVRGARGIYTVLRVSFTAAGHGTLVREIPVTFHAVVGKTSASAHARNEKGKTSRRGRKQGHGARR